MKLDRNVKPSGNGKYALIKMRGELLREELDCIQTLVKYGRIDYGKRGEKDEFFVIKLRDRCARSALEAYADSVMVQLHDNEYAEEIREMARRSGPWSPFCKDPD